MTLRLDTLGWVALLALAAAAPKKSPATKPSDAPFSPKSKWTGTLNIGSREQTVNASVQASSATGVTFRFACGDHGTRDWKFTLRGTQLVLASCVATSASSDTQIKDLDVSGEFRLNADKAADAVMCAGRWVFQSKRAGGTERIKLTLKPAGAQGD